MNRFPILVLSLGSFIGCSRPSLTQPPSPSPGMPTYTDFMAANPGPAYSALEARRSTLIREVDRIQVGMTMKEVSTILGTPDYSRSNFGPKGPGEHFLGWSWMYYITKPDMRLVNEIKDKCVHVFFNEYGYVSSIYKRLPE